MALIAGVGASVPSGAYADVAELGVQGRLGVTLHVTPAVTLAGIAFYDRNPHNIAGNRSDVYGVEVLVGYALSMGSGLELSPWGGIGGVVHARRSGTYPGLNASQRGVALTGGATLSKAVGRVSPFLSGFYARGIGDLGRDSYPTEGFSIGAGLEIPLGGN